MGAENHADFFPSEDERTLQIAATETTRKWVYNYEPSEPEEEYGRRELFLDVLDYASEKFDSYNWF